MELGVNPVRFEILKLKLLFLQYISKQEKDSMIPKVFKASCEHPLYNDFVQTCNNYLEELEIKLTYENI